MNVEHGSVHQEGTRSLLPESFNVQPYNTTHKQKMVNGINFITDEKGNKTGIILDLITFRKHHVLATEVINALSGLQELIDGAENPDKESKNWDLAKEQLKAFKGE